MANKRTRSPEEVPKLQLSVVGLDGSDFELRVDREALGLELLELVQQRVGRRSGQLKLYCGAQELLLSEPLHRHLADGAVVSYVFHKVNLWGAWQSLMKEREPRREAAQLFQMIHHIQPQMPPGQAPDEAEGPREMCLKSADVPLPRSLEILQLNIHRWNFYQPDMALQLDLAHTRIHTLVFGDDFDTKLDEIVLPCTLRKLQFGAHFNRSLKNVQIPSSLEELIFGHNFNQSMKGVNLGENLKTLVFGRMFNMSMRSWKIPHSVRHLTLGETYNHILKGVKFPELESFTFCGTFKEKVAEVNWPESLQKLTLGPGFKSRTPWFPPQLQTLDVAPSGYRLATARLPETLQHLKLNPALHQDLKGLHLPQLRSLDLGGCTKGVQQLCFPSSLESLTAMCPALLDGTKLPMSLQSLRISGRFPKTLEEMVFPGGLQDLTLGDGFQSCQGLKLPSGLKSLTFGRCFNSPIRDLLLPGSLERLQFGDYFDQSLEPPFALPTSLKSLSFGFDFDKPLDLVELPDSLQSLTLGQRFNQEVALVRWPRSLEHLAFGCNFSQNLTGVRLPENLKSLAFGHRFHQSLREVQLPEQLESLTFCDYGNFHMYRINQTNMQLKDLAHLQNLKHLSITGFDNFMHQNSYEGIKDVNLPPSLQSVQINGEFVAL